MTDRTHDISIRLHNIRMLLIDQARKLRTGESDGVELDLLLKSEDMLRTAFEEAYRAEHA